MPFNAEALNNTPKNGSVGCLVPTTHGLFLMLCPEGILNDGTSQFTIEFNL